MYITILLLSLGSKSEVVPHIFFTIFALEATTNFQSFGYVPLILDLQNVCYDLQLSVCICGLKVHYTLASYRNVL